MRRGILGALLNQEFQHIGRSASTIGRPCVLGWLYINGQTLELCLMAIITLSVPVAREQGAGVGEGAKLFEEFLAVRSNRQHHGNVGVA